MNEHSPTQATPGRDVFISYASQDVAVANAMVKALERHGLTCWIAPRDVQAGAQYADAIVRAIGNAKAFVLVLSANAAASSHVAREVERAASKHRRILALRIDTAPLTPALEYFLGESQWVEVRSGELEAACARLIEAIRAPALPVPADVPSATHETSRVRPSAARLKLHRSRIVLAIGLGVLVLTLGVLWADRSWLTKHASAEHATVPAAAVQDKSIAVLPFVDMSEKHDQEYFGDGMAEEILDLLARIPGLTVIGRTSSFQFKGKNADLRTIGAQLNAAYVLEGSVRKSGDQVRITAQLIDTRTGTHEWSETYDRHIGDVLKLQDSMAAAVARELQLTVTTGDLRSRAIVKNPDAYDLMLRGRHALDRLDKDGLDQAVNLFRQSLELDPTSADAMAALAWAYDVQGEWGFVAPTVAFEQAGRAATAALKINPSLALAHRVLGRVHLVYEWDWAAAEREFKNVATLTPGNGDAIDSEALLSMTLGRWDDSLRQIKTALVQDPLDPPSLYVLTEVQMHIGHLPEAEEAMRRILDIRPNFGGGHYLLGLVLLARGDRNAALEEMQRETDDPWPSAGLAIAHYAIGRKVDSDAELTRLIKEHADDSAYAIAEVYAYRGQSNEATQWLERAHVQKDCSLIFVKAELSHLSLGSDPRFKAFLRKMNLLE